MREIVRENNIGCAVCPKCGEVLPLGNSAPEILRHIVFRENGTYRVICWKYVMELMGWMSKP